jgi:hypothetical protein
VDVVYDAPRVDSPAGAAKLADVVDRCFVLVWLGFYVLLPVSGWAHIMFTGWFDQRRDLAALRSVIAFGHADVIAQNGVGPAYIGTAAVIHDVLRVSPEDALVLLTRGSYVLSVALGLLLVRMLVRQLVEAPPMVTLGAQVALVGLVFAAGTWHWSDVPWSHFFAALLAVALYAARFVPARTTIASAAAIGGALSLLALTRSFELVALLLAWGFALVVLAALRLSGPRVFRLGHVAAGVAAFVATTAAVYVVTGKRGFFFLYGSNLDQQSGNVTSAESAHTPTFSFSLVPVKLMQLFVEPCYDALCSLSDYAGGAHPLPPEVLGGAKVAGNERLWRLPIAVQLPSLVLLPVCVLAVAGIVVWALRNREAARRRTRAIGLLVESTVAASGLVVGYSASTLTGSPHLRYGFARDFLLPALLTGIVAVALVSAGVWLALSRRRARRVSPEFTFVVLAVVGSACLLVAFAYARANGIPRVESHALGAVTYSATCRSDSCAVVVRATTTSGRSISIPESSILTFGCGSATPRFTLYAENPTAGVRLTRPCAGPRLVAAWPTVMGLPPGTYELNAVKVRNA